MWKSEKWEKRKKNEYNWVFFCALQHEHDINEVKKKTREKKTHTKRRKENEKEKKHFKSEHSLVA